MSQFNRKLEEAKRRQKRIYFLCGFSVLVLLILVAAMFVISRGTRIEINPEEAREIAETRVLRGGGFRIGEAIYTLIGNPTISVTAPGFKTAREKIGSEYLGRIFPVVLTELPGHLTIELTNKEIDLSDTAWEIDGLNMAISSALDIKHKAGAYTVTIDNQFHQIKEMAVEINRGEQTQLQTDLSPVKGVLNITSRPPGATVFFGEEKVGVTPLHIDGKGGGYSLRISSDSYIDIEDELEITRSETTVRRNYRLERKKGTVVLSLSPKGGKLLVDGARAGNTVTLDVIVEHQISYMKEGYYPQIQTVALGIGEEKEVVFNLKAEVGEVLIGASPSATVWIDERNYGITPVTVSLPAVNHKISLKRAGYRTAIRKVQPKGGTVKKLSVQLQTEYQARLREAPAEYTNDGGIKMKMFRVNDGFRMGAPRSQKGQRANEVEREVRLTKPFYVSFYEITQGQFSKFNSEKAIRNASDPVTNVSWEEAVYFCNWLSSKERLHPFYRIENRNVTGFNTNTDGYRLLSEAEWEWLARKAGKKKQSLFGWGETTIIPARATNVADESAKGQVRFFIPNYNDGYPGVAPVGSFDPEPAGLYDMSGNVSEWVHDFYSMISSDNGKIEINPFGLVRGQAHVVKGANWSSGTLTTLRSSFREGLTAGRNDVGFRIARYLYGEEDEKITKDN